MANITDKFCKVADGTGVYPSVASVTASREQGADTLSCDDLSGWTTDTPVHFSTFRLNADGTPDRTSQTDWKGIVSDNTITQMTRLAGAEDSGHLAGDKVIQNPTIGWVADLVDGLLKSHNADGSLRDNIVQTRNIQENSVTSLKIADKAVTGAKIGDNTIRASNIDINSIMDVLFESSSGSTTDITLSKSAAEYTRIKIYASTSDGFRFSEEVYQPNNKNIVLSFTNASGNAWIKVAVYNCSGRSLKHTNVSGNESGEYTVRGDSWIATNSRIKIHRIEGYKV